MSFILLFYGLFTLFLLKQFSSDGGGDMELLDVKSILAVEAIFLFWW